MCEVNVPLNGLVKFCEKESKARKVGRQALSNILESSYLIYKEWKIGLASFYWPVSDQNLPLYMSFAVIQSLYSDNRRNTAEWRYRKEFALGTSLT